MAIFQDHRKTTVWRNQIQPKQPVAMGLPAQRLLGCRRLARALWLPVVCGCDILAAAVAVVA